MTITSYYGIGKALEFKITNPSLTVSATAKDEILIAQFPMGYNQIIRSLYLRKSPAVANLKCDVEFRSAADPANTVITSGLFKQIDFTTAVTLGAPIQQTTASLSTGLYNNTPIRLFSSTAPNTLTPLIMALVFSGAAVPSSFHMEISIDTFDAEESKY